MPPSLKQAWSTQYKDDYHQTTRCHRKPPAPKKPSSAGIRRRQVPAATQISVFTYKNAQGNSMKSYGGDQKCQEKHTDQQLNLAVDRAKTNMGQGSAQVLQDTNVLGQATKTVRSEAEPVIPEPVKLRTATPPPKNLHWSCWPEPIPKEKKRPNTSLGFHREDAKGNAGIENSGPPGVDPEFFEEALLHEYQVPHKEDKMLSPMRRSNTFHYEPQQTRLTSISVNDPPVRDTYTMYNQQRRSQSVTPTQHYNQSFFPYHKPGGAGVREDMVLNNFAKSMEGKQPLPNQYQYSFHKYPFTTRQPRKAALGEDYVHQHSMFMVTTPRCSGHFIIHPDWVSERGGMKRSRSFIQNKNLDGLRY